MKRVSSTAAPAAPAAPACVEGPTSCTLPKNSKRRVPCQEAKSVESVNLLRKRNRVSLQDLAAASPPDKHGEAVPAPRKRSKGTAQESCSTSSSRLNRLARRSSPTPEEHLFVVLSQESTPEKAEKAPAEPLRGMPAMMDQGQERPGACHPWPRPQSLQACFDFEQTPPTSFRACSSGEGGLELSWQMEVGEGFEAGYESALCDERNAGDMQARAGELLNEERARLLQQQQLSMRFEAHTFDGEWSSAYNDGYMERMKELSCCAPHGAHEGAFTQWPEPDGSGISASSAAAGNSQAREEGLAEGFETGYKLALDHLHASLRREGFDVSCLQAPDSSGEFREAFKEGFGKGYTEAFVDLQAAETCRGFLLFDP